MNVSPKEEMECKAMNIKEGKKSNVLNNRRRQDCRLDESMFGKQ